MTSKFGLVVDLKRGVVIEDIDMGDIAESIVILAAMNEVGAGIIKKMTDTGIPEQELKMLIERGTQIFKSINERRRENAKEKIQN